MTKMQSDRRRGPRARARRRHHGVRRARRRDQPAVLGAEGARQHHAHPRRATSKARRTWPRATRAPAAGNIGVCIGTSGPAGTDMITGLYSASADSIPILCITGQAPRARLHKEDFQAVDIDGDREARQQVGDDRDGARAGAARVSAGVPPDALGPSRSGADRPAVRRADGRDRVRSRDLRAAAGLQAEGDAQADREGAGDAERRRAAADRRRRRHHQRRRVRAARRSSPRSPACR